MRLWRGIIRARIAALEEQIRQAGQARDYLGHALQCPSEHPVDQCPQLRAILDSQLADLGERRGASGVPPAARQTALLSRLAQSSAETDR